MNSSSAFGFVSTPRGTSSRDPSFMGSSNNPSKKGPMIQPRLPARTPPQSSIPAPSTGARAVPPPQHPLPAPAPRSVAHDTPAMLARRCEYLEAQLKQHTSALSDANAALSHLREAIDAMDGTPSLRATVVLDTLEFQVAADSAEAAARSVAPATVSAGTPVYVSFPMQEVAHDGRVLVCMRSTAVDQHTAALSYGWIVVYEHAAGARYVSDFAVM